MSKALIFPGQGSQVVGMGKDLFDEYESARLVFLEVDDALNKKLSKTIFYGPEKELLLTENAQPALMAMSIAVVRVLESNGLKIQDYECVAGHSLGEYTALTAANAINLSDAAVALQKRGKLMQKAVPIGQGAMAAIIGLDIAIVSSILSNCGNGVCEIANHNSPDQIVISGYKSDVECAVEEARKSGSKRCVILPVSAPFHCSLMKPAAEGMKSVLDGIKIISPTIPLISNVNALPVIDTQEIKSLLVQQIISMVRWNDIMSFMIERKIQNLLELGSGRALSGLAKRVSRNFIAHSVQSVVDIEKIIKEI